VLVDDVYAAIIIVIVLTALILPFAMKVLYARMGNTNDQG